MTRYARALPAMATVILMLGGCGGGDASPDPMPSGPSIPPDQRGTPAPEALSDLSCAATDQGTWSATGTIKNTTEAAVTYRVTAYVGPADGQERPAVDTTLEDVQADGSSRFELTGIPSHGGENPVCHVQVLIPE